jgi:Domain of unknown function (DUF5107)
MVKVEESDEILLTNPLVPAGPLPTAADPEGVYPYESFSETSRRPVLRKYRMVTLENDRIRVKLCPDLGGRVTSILQRDSGLESLFNPRIIRPVRILPRHAYIGGGIEVSFPISHTPVETVRVLYDIARDSNRVYVSCGEREVRFGMNWTVEYSVGDRDEFLTQRTVFRNPDSTAHAWMSWSNAGVPARPDTEFHFPGGPVLAHGREVRIIDWDTEGPRTQSSIKSMIGYFWRHPDCCAFGAFTPSLGVGLYHVADPSLAPGMKLWSDGVGRDERWVSQYTLDGGQCLEIQAGPLVDQSVKDTLAAGAERYHIEFWLPSAASWNIREIALPCPPLRELSEVPKFDWVPSDYVGYWLTVLSGHQSGQLAKLPNAPDLDDNRWAISGMSELGAALRWAATVTDGKEKHRWLFQLGAWLAGRGDLDAALEVLANSRDDRARAFSGRLWYRRKNARAAAECFRSIESEAVTLHPQVVFERDEALACLGPETLSERTRWLDAVSALDDEWVAERRASLAIDSGDFSLAGEILRNTRFQLVHQRYARTRLWRRVEKKLGLEPVDYPSWLGEDDLAEFGAYREYSEPSQD